MFSIRQLLAFNLGLILCLVYLFTVRKGKDQTVLCSLVETTTLANIFYVHVPKCGSSFATLLTQYGCPAFPKNITIQEPSLLLWPGNDPMNFTEHCSGAFRRFNSGHGPMPKNLPSSFWLENNPVTILRQPETRIISGFLHNIHDCAGKRSGLPPGALQINSKYLNESVILGVDKRNLTQLFKEYWRCVEGCATHMLLGEDCGNNHDKDRVTLDKVQEAISISSRFAFIGLQERWAESAVLWQKLYGGDFSDAILVNTRRNQYSENMYNTLREIAIQENLVDYADEMLYQHVKSRFTSLQESLKKKTLTKLAYPS